MNNFFSRFKNSNAALLWIFFFSGFAGLTYELVWIRELSVVFGKTISAVTIVVAVYMAGLGLGSIYWGKRIDSGSNHLRVFSFLQLGIGASSFVILFLFPILPLFYKFIYHLLGASSVGSLFLIFLVSFFCILVPTFLMGGTLPVISKIFIHSDQEIGRGIGLLYAVNTAGGIIGAGLTGYYFISTFGQIQTQIIAVCINLLLGFSTFMISSREHGTKKEKGIKTKEAVSSAGYPERIIKLVLLVAGFSGFCGLAYEILSTRALSIFLFNSSYSFSSILIIFLLGISVGSAVFTQFFSTRNNHLLILSICQIIIGLYIMMVVAFLNDLPMLLFPLKKNLLLIPVFKMVLPGIVLSSALLFIPAVCMGISFPILCKIVTSGINDLGIKVGKVYFVNTMGSIIGPLCAGFILIPLCGVCRGSIIIAGISLAMGIVLFILTADQNKRRKRTLISFGFIVIGIVFAVPGMTTSMILPPSVFRTPAMVDKILFYKETSSGTVIVREDEATTIRTLYVNNSAACGVVYDAITVVRMLGHLPFIINPSIKEVLIIGFGIGVTTSAVAQHPINNIDCVEICPGVRDAAKYFTSHNNNITSHPRVTFISGDGRNHVLLTKNKYELISCDPTHPNLGCGSLYTREYFQLCRDHLTDNGIVSQYLPLHNLSPDEFKSVIKSFHSVFPHTTVWLAHSHGILLGTMKKVDIDFLNLKNFLYELNDEILNDPYRFSTALFLDAPAIALFTRDAVIHSDNRPFLEFFTPRSLRKENWHINLSSMMKHRIDPSNTIKNIDDQEKFARYLIGQEFFLGGLISKNKGEWQNVIDLFRKAREINPENREIRIFLENEIKRYGSRLSNMK